MEERLRLSQDIFDAQKAQAEADAILGQKEIALKYAEPKVEVAFDTVRFHRQNISYMKTRADVVDIKEFAGARKLLDQAIDEWQEACAKVRKLHGEIQHYNNVASAAVRAIEVARSGLAQFGRLIQWRPRD